MRYQKTTLLKKLLIVSFSLLLASCGGGEEPSTNNANNSASDSEVNSPISNPQILNSATISWAPPLLNEDGSSITDLAGYRIYCGENEDTYTLVKDISNIGQTSFTIENITSDTYVCVMTAYNTSGYESAYTAPPAIKTFL